jgi:hypothetical protein
MLANLATVSMVFASLLAIWFALKHRTRHPNLAYVFIYPLTSFFQAVISGFCNAPQALNSVPCDYALRISGNIFLIIEFATAYGIFWDDIVHSIGKRIAFFIICIYLIFNTSDLFFFSHSFINLDKLFLVHSAFVLFPIILYFVNLFITEETLQSFTEPKFWLATGFFVYLSCTLPLFLLIDVVLDRKTGNTMENGVYAINDFSYAFLFILFIKAFSCKKKYKNIMDNATE